MMSKNKISGPVFIALVFSLVIPGCTTDDDFGPQNSNPDDSQPEIRPEEKRVLILNEGNFQHGNASLDAYDPASAELNSEVFKTETGSRLGDVAQSITQIGDTLAVVINNSSKILYLQKKSYELSGTTEGLNSPRYLIELPGGNFIVSELYSEKLYEIDRGSLEVIAEHQASGWTEKMHVSSSVLYVQNVTDKSLDEYDLNALTRNRQLQKGLVRAVDFYGDKVISASHEGIYVKRGSDAFEKVVTFEDTLSVLRISHNPSTETVYILAGGVYKADLNSGEVNLLIPSEGANFYGLCADRVTGEFYVTDAKDYVSRGEVFLYDISGTLIDNFKAGILPQHIEILYESPNP